VIMHRHRHAMRSWLTSKRPNSWSAEVFLIRCQARPHRVGPADLLKPGRDLAVIQVRVVAAFGADELKRASVAAFRLALDAGRLAAQAGRIAVAQLASKRECHDTLVVDARPRVTGIVRAAR
jgi:hypothetical protein